MKRSFGNNPDGCATTLQNIYVHRHATSYDREVANEYRLIHERMTPGSRAAKAWRKSAQKRNKQITLAKSPFDFRSDQ